MKDQVDDFNESINCLDGCYNYYNDGPYKIVIFTFLSVDVEEKEKNESNINKKNKLNQKTQQKFEYAKLNKPYLNLKEEKEENSVNLQFVFIYNSVMYHKNFTKNDMIELKQSLGVVNSSWKGFFKNILNSITNQNGGQIVFNRNELLEISSKVKNQNIETSKFNSKFPDSYNNLSFTNINSISSLNSQIEEFEYSISLALYLSISDSIKLKLNLSLNTVDKMSEQNLYKEMFMKSLQNCTKLKNVINSNSSSNLNSTSIDNNTKDKILIKNSEQFGNTQSNLHNNLKETGKKILDLKKNKRKFKSDLINPNVKKRNVQGVKFVSENSDSEKISEYDEEEDKDN
jgi:hypothetical protein